MKFFNILSDSSKKYTALVTEANYSKYSNGICTLLTTLGIVYLAVQTYKDACDTDSSVLHCFL